MSAAEPLVSVLVPVYNGARYLDATLASIRAQKYRALEILVKDDGSTDGSVEIAERHAAEDPRIRFVTGSPSGGAVPNHVALAEMATGEFVKFCHQDDLLDERHVSELLPPLLAHPGIALALSVRTRIGADGRQAPGGASYAPLINWSGAANGHTVITNALLTGLNQLGEPTVGLFRNGLVTPSTLFSFGDYPLTALFDLGMWFNLLLLGHLYYDTRPLSSYRNHAESLMHQPLTIARCPLEWLGIAREARRQGLLPRGEPTRRFGMRQHRYMARIEQVLSAYPDPAVRAELAEISERHGAEVAELTGVRRSAVVMR